MHSVPRVDFPHLMPVWASRKDFDHQHATDARTMLDLAENAEQQLGSAHEKEKIVR